MAGLNLDGLSSGLPTSDIIDQLMQFERIPLYSYNEDLNELEVEKGAWRDVNSRISNLESSLSALKLSATFNSNTTSSSDGDVATATAASEAVAGDYNVTVNNLATTHRVASDMQTDATSALGHSGDIEINGQTVTIESTFSLNDIMTAINETDNIGAEATVINNTLVLESSETGIANQLQVTDGNNVLTDLGILSSGSATNVALTGTMSASSQYSADFPVESLNDGIIDQTNWGNGQGWNDATANDFTDDWVELDFGTDGNGDPVVNRVDQVVLNTRDDATHPASIYGVKDYEVQYWDNDTGSWQTAATVTGNTQGEVVTNFDAVETNRLRIQVNDANDGEYSRLVEVGAYNTGEEFKNVLQDVQDANLSISGIAISSASNQIEDAVTGLSFNIENTGSTTIEVSADTQKSTSAVQSFVDQYNSVMNFIDTKTDYDPDTEKAGVLQGDSTLMRLQMRVRSLLTDSVNTTSDYDQLAMVGISIDRDGVMSLDSTKLQDALSDDSEAVMKLFNGDTDDGDAFDGVATKLDSYLDQLIQTNTGVIPTRVEYYDKSIDRINDDIEDFERSLESTRERYLQQFTAMEKAISEMQAQGNWFMSQISSLSNTSMLNSIGGGQ